MIVVVERIKFCRFRVFRDSDGTRLQQNSGRPFASGERHKLEVTAPDADLAEQGAGLLPQCGPLRRIHLGGRVEVQPLRVFQLRSHHGQARAPITEDSRSERQHRIEQEVLFGEIGSRRCAKSLLQPEVDQGFRRYTLPARFHPYFAE